MRWGEGCIVSCEAEDGGQSGSVKERTSVCRASRVPTLELFQETEF